eukprot:TRINITY_DN6764_c0_g1_i2.p1 TRINITY_DN6764_c0_g1~~TRINITY_DN6764_c0_g1_i2.p1  ORF type:complete len:1554 (-),score=274.53 TRINITY_DN6764_c0_g1_i2:18-4403(-)
MLGAVLASPKALLATAYQAWANLSHLQRACKSRADKVLWRMAGSSSRLQVRRTFDAWAKAHRMSECELAVNKVRERQLATLQHAATLLACTVNDPWATRAAVYQAWAQWASSMRTRFAVTQHALVAMAKSSYRLVLSHVIASWAKSCLRLKCEEAVSKVQFRQEQTLDHLAAVLARVFTNSRIPQVLMFKVWAESSKASECKAAQAMRVQRIVSATGGLFLLCILFGSWLKARLVSGCSQTVEKLQKERECTLQRCSDLLAAATGRLQDYEAAVFMAWGGFVQTTKSRARHAQKVLSAIAGVSNHLLLCTPFYSWRHSSFTSNRRRAVGELNLARQQREGTLQRAAGLLAWAMDNPRTQQAKVFRMWASCATSACVRDAHVHQVMLAMTNQATRLLLSTLMSVWTRSCLMIRCEQKILNARKQQSATVCHAAALLAIGVNNPTACMRTALHAWCGWMTSARARKLQTKQVMLAMVASSDRLSLGCIVAAWVQACLKLKCEKAVGQFQRRHERTVQHASNLLALAFCSPQVQQLEAFTAWCRVLQSAKLERDRFKQVMLAMAGPSSRLMLSSTFAEWTKACLRAKHEGSVFDLECLRVQQQEIMMRAAAMLGAAMADSRAQLVAAYQSWAVFSKTRRANELRAGRVMRLVAGPSSMVVLRRVFDAWAKAQLMSECESTVHKVREQQLAALHHAASLLASAATNYQARRAAAFTAWAQWASVMRARRAKARRAILAMANSSDRQALSVCLASWAKSCLQLKCEEAVSRVQARQNLTLDRAAGVLTRVITSSHLQRSLSFKVWADVTRVAKSQQCRVARMQKTMQNTEGLLTLCGCFGVWLKVCLASRFMHTIEEITYMRKKQHRALEQCSSMLFKATDRVRGQQCGLFRAWLDLVGLRKLRERQIHDLLLLLRRECQLIVCMMFAEWLKTCLISRFEEAGTEMKLRVQRQEVKTHQFMSVVATLFDRQTLAAVVASWATFCLNRKFEEAVKTLQSQQTRTLNHAAEVLTRITETSHMQKFLTIRVWADLAKAAKCKMTLVVLVEKSVLTAQDSVALCALFEAWLKAYFASRLGQTLEVLRCSHTRQESTLQRYSTMLVAANNRLRVQQPDIFWAWVDLFKFNKSRKQQVQHFTAVIRSLFSKLALHTVFEEWRKTCRTAYFAKVSDALWRAREQRDESLQQAFSIWANIVATLARKDAHVHHIILTKAIQSNKLILSNLMSHWVRLSLLTRCECAVRMARKQQAATSWRAAAIFASNAQNSRAEMLVVLHAWAHWASLVRTMETQRKQVMLAIVDSSDRFALNCILSAWSQARLRLKSQDMLSQLQHRHKQAALHATNLLMRALDKPHAQLVMLSLRQWHAAVQTKRHLKTSELAVQRLEGSLDVQRLVFTVRCLACEVSFLRKEGKYQVSKLLVASWATVARALRAARLPGNRGLGRHQALSAPPPLSAPPLPRRPRAPKLC